MSFLGSSYYRGAHAALLCYSVANRDTFTILSQYILDLVMNAEGAKIFLCGNMSDKVNPDPGSRPVTDADLEQFLSQCEEVLSGTFRVSCKDGSGLEEMFKEMACVLHRDAVSRLTLRRDLIKPGESPEKGAINSENRSCC